MGTRFQRKQKGGFAGRRGGMTIGILGGSFNPAHEGHRHISLEALKRLGLDRDWWMVSPQNPLKPAAGMAEFDDRLAGARRAARHPRIEVTDIEARLGTRYTAETLAKLRTRFPRHRFVWLMGSDNLSQIRHWRDWNKIFINHPLAVFSRSPYDSRALAGLAARRYRRRRISGDGVRGLGKATPPAWVFLAIRRHPASATAIRAASRGS